jgi:hypothetical protein
MEMAHSEGINLITISHLRLVVIAQVKGLSTVINRIPLTGRLTTKCLLDIERDQEYLINYYEQLNVFSDSPNSPNVEAFAALDRLRVAYFKLIDDLGHVRARHSEREESQDSGALQA